MTASSTIDPQLKSWIEVPTNSDFPIQNLPFGVFRTQSNQAPRVCTIIGNSVIDLAVMNYLSLLDDLDISSEVFSSDSINGLMALGRQKVRSLRHRIADIFAAGNEEAIDSAWHVLHPVEKVEMLMPIKVGDYTDFYSSREHATNVGTMFRDPKNALMPNWLHLPVGYHGRASSIVVSGTPVRRPMGQTRPDPEAPPVFGASRLLDFELEMAFVIGKANKMGARITTDAAEDHIFGMVLFNDWSARDIQKWEYVPLGPFLGKSFASTISPWVVTLDALEPFRVPGPVQEPAVLPYLQYQGDKNYNINLEVAIQPEGGQPSTICRSNFKHLYWNIAQQLAHHTVNGCNMQVGDMCASGTISGPEPSSYGSMLELSWRGSKPLKLDDGSERKFIQDGDTVILSGFCEKDGLRIGFGEATGKVLPAQG